MNKNCMKCGLSKTRRLIVHGCGPVPADILVIGDAINEADQIVNRPMAGDSGRFLQRLLVSSGLAYPSFRVISVVKCRSHTEGIDRAPLKEEVLACTPNILEEAKETKPKLILLVGKDASTYYKSEFPNALEIQSMWYYAKYPSTWPVVVQEVREALKWLK